jgi:hypothetical protein
MSPNNWHHILFIKIQKYNLHITLLGHNHTLYLHYALIKLGIIVGMLHSPSPTIVHHPWCTTLCQNTYTIYITILRKIKLCNFTTPTTIPTIISCSSQPTDPRNVPPSLLLVHRVVPFFYQAPTQVTRLDSEMWFQNFSFPKMESCIFSFCFLQNCQKNSVFFKRPISFFLSTLTFQSKMHTSSTRKYPSCST